MGKVNFTAEQIVAALRRAEGGTPVVEVCRKLGVSEQTGRRSTRGWASSSSTPRARRSRSASPWSAPRCRISP